METKERMAIIHENSIMISACVQSLQFILKDLDEMEIKANNSTNNDYVGLTNVVEQLTIRIMKENDVIMSLSE